MKRLAIIPARGGSKRIPRKNIKSFCGKPIIAYSIEAAINSGLFDDVMVSTDDEEIAEIGQQYGAKVPFKRSAENANDFATTVDVVVEVLNKYKAIGFTYTYACCIYPTAPLVSIKNLKNTLELLVDRKYDSVFPVVQFSYPILRALKIDEANKASMMWPENINKRSQDLPKAYHDAGQFYWMNVNSVLNKQLIITDNSGVCELPETEVQDIDNETDWELAQLKYQLINNTI
jgi:pseudaminic acid cytidylyltransferase